MNVAARITATIASSLLIGATAVTAPASSAPAPAGAPVASTALPCPVTMGVVAGGRYRTVSVGGVATPPTITDFGAVSGGTSVRSLATGFYDTDFLTPDTVWHKYEHLGNTTGSLFKIVARDDAGTRTNRVTPIATTWGGFRRLVMAGQGDFSGSSADALYGLHDNGSLYRYRIRAVDGKVTATAAGRVTGFSDLKTITLIASAPGYHALLANTTSGQLVVIKIPTTSTMTAKRTVIRTRTWQGLEHLAARTCNDGTTTLVGVDRDNGAAFAYSMDVLRDTSSRITGYGRVQGVWNYGVLTSTHYWDLPPQGA